MTQPAATTELWIGNLITIPTSKVRGASEMRVVEQSRMWEIVIELPWEAAVEMVKPLTAYLQETLLRAVSEDRHLWEAARAVIVAETFTHYLAIWKHPNQSVWYLIRKQR